MSIRYVNKALSLYKKTWETIGVDKEGMILIKEGNKEKNKKWNDYYVFKDDKEYQEWKKWVIEDLREMSMGNLSDERILMKFDWIDCTYGLGQPYLFENVKEIKNEEDDSPTY